MENNLPNFQGSVPNHSEGFGNNPNGAEAFRIVPQAAERTENHTLTVREAARMFEVAGVARTERSIINWCQPNKVGVSRLDAYFDPNERKYFMTCESVDRAIAEEKAKATRAPESSETFGSIPNDAERDSEKTSERRQPPAAANSDHTNEMERELMDLKITNRAKDQFIQQLQGERNDMLDKLIANSRVIGQLETKLLQIEGPASRTEPLVNELI